MPESLQELDPGMPDGYSDIFDRNLNDFADEEIDQVLNPWTSYIGLQLTSLLPHSCLLNCG